MRIHVRTLTGKSIPCDVTPTTTIDELKEMIQNYEDISPDQRIMFAGKVLETRYEYEAVVTRGRSAEGKINIDAKIEDLFLEQQKSTCVISNRDIAFHSGLRVSFQRTLRIPDDGKVYPLPPSLGSFPIYNVKDYDNVPASWKEHGGVFIPMFQNEALWMSFDDSYAHALKVAVGKVNAVSGEPYVDQLSSTPQDYLVIPPQRWLDGFNSGDGCVRQFVATPLGVGLSVEAQVTGHEHVGGIQIEAVPMRRDRPLSGSFMSRSITDETMHMTPRQLGFKEGDVILWKSNKKPMSLNLLAYVRQTTLRDYNIQKDSTLHLVLRLRGGGPTNPDMEMGLSAGGQIKQKIYIDTHSNQPSVEHWDLSARSRCFVHIVNSAHFKHITGQDAPTTHYITAAEYTRHGLPWFDMYGDDRRGGVGAPKVLKEVRGIAAISKEKGVHIEEPTSVHVKKHHIKHVHISDGKW